MVCRQGIAPPPRRRPGGRPASRSWLVLACRSGMLSGDLVAEAVYAVAPSACLCDSSRESVTFHMWDRTVEHRPGKPEDVKGSLENRLIADWPH